MRAEIVSFFGFLTSVFGQTGTLKKTNFFRKKDVALLYTHLAPFCSLRYITIRDIQPEIFAELLRAK
jgi:hypothetical protein